MVTRHRYRAPKVCTAVVTVFVSLLRGQATDKTGGTYLRRSASLGWYNKGVMGGRHPATPPDGRRDRVASQQRPPWKRCPVPNPRGGTAIQSNSRSNPKRKNNLTVLVVLFNLRSFSTMNFLVEGRFFQ